MRSNSTAERAGSTWVADAEPYDRWFDSPWGSYAFATERQAILAAAGNLTGKTVADIGCGTGRFTTELDRRAGHVVGSDPDRQFGRCEQTSPETGPFPITCAPPSN